MSFNGSRATTSRPDQTTNSLMNKNVFSINDDTLANNEELGDENDLLLNQSKTMASAHASRNASRTNLKGSNNNLFDAYENQIIKNIQSIRRNSNSSGSGGSNSKINNNNSSSRRGSSGASSNSNRSSSKKLATTTVMTMPSSSLSQPNLNKAQSNYNDNDDDDDDIFSGSSQLVKPMTAVSMNAKSASLTNLKANNSLEKQANLDYTDDISFNDDYGDENEDEERMLKTKNFGNTLKSNQRGKQETAKKVVANTQAPPKPVPRKKYAQEEEDDDDDDDDSDQNVDDYGDEEEEEEDDKF